ncbi:MAG: rhodanese-like domain-containing protein, partial [Burkholderiaceae bacterium]
LAYRAFDAVSSDETTIVVNCAGRTRGIIGAQSLINAGIRNPVVTLMNGTQGWVLSGRQMARGNMRVAAPPTAAGLQRATEAAARIARRFGVTEIDAAQLEEFRADAERTLFLFDVRTPEEYAAGHLPGSRSAPGGQLIQSTDYYVGTRHPRLVLCDDTGVRARMTASWLLQLGLRDVYVLKGGLAQPGSALAYGAEPAEVLPPADGGETEVVTVAQLDQALAGGGVEVLDLTSSLDYRRAHIPGAWFAVRSRIVDALQKLEASKQIVLTSSDGAFARLASGDVARMAGRAVRCLQGGTAAWKAAGMRLADGEERMASPADDVWHSPYDAKDQRAAMLAYLKWEVELMHQLEREGGTPFKSFAAEAGDGNPR